MKFKHLLMSLLAVVALAACGNNNDDPTPPPTPGNDDFEITVHDIFHTKCKLDVKAKNPEMPLYFGIYGKKDFETYVNDADFIQSIMENIERIANNYGMTLQELLESELKVGSVENFEYNDNVYPDTEYIAYAFGLDKQGNVLTGLNKVEFRTPAVGMEDCTFEITSVDLTATSFKVNVKPSNPNTEYYYDVMSSSTYQEVGSSADGIRSVVLSVMNRGIEEYGYTVYEAVQRMTSAGEVTSEEGGETLGVTPNSTWYAFAIGLGVDGTFTTEPTIVAITTLSESENTFETMMGDIAPDKATVYVGPSKPYETWAWLTIADEDAVAEGKPMTDEQIIEYMLNSDRTMSVYGSYSIKEQKLRPQTAYTTYIMGYSNGIATTGLTKQQFTTAAPEFYDDVMFEIRASNILMNDITWSVLPSDETVTYYYDAMPEEDYQAKGGNDNAIKADIEAGIEYYSQAMNITEHEFIYNHISMGGISVDRNGALKKDTEYRFYVVGMYADGTLTTPIYSIKARTRGDHDPMNIVLAYNEYDKTYPYSLWGYAPANYSYWYWLVTIDDDKYESYNDAQLLEVLVKEWKQNSNAAMYYPGLYRNLDGTERTFDPAKNTIYIYYVVYNGDEVQGPIHRLRCENGVINEY